MKYAILTVKLLFWAYTGYLFLFLLTSYEPAQPGFRPPFALFVMDSINLFIHEAGHLFFRVFGMWMHMIAGSLFQVLLPLALMIVTWRQNIAQIGYPGFWVGQSLVNVSVYIKDAPYKQLKLIAKGLIHDWNWLLSDDLEAAEPLGDIVFLLGITACALSIGAGVYFALKAFKQYKGPSIPE
ncbi:MAG: hypothetical protein WBG01_08495 [Bacteroidota bacterium]